MPRYYFETLPLHPQPEHLESFTSYTTRLAELNGVRNMPDLARLFFSVTAKDIADAAKKRLTDYLLTSDREKRV